LGKSFTDEWPRTMGVFSFKRAPSSKNDCPQGGRDELQLLLSYKGQGRGKGKGILNSPVAVSKLSRNF